MHRSDWGDWLLRDVESASPDGVALWYLGCNGFIVKAADGTTLFIDPYLGLGDPPRTVRMIPVPFDATDVTEADAVLATHEHTDHVHGPSQAPILANTDATFLGPSASIAVTEEEGWTDEWEIDDAQIRTIGQGDRLEIGELTVHVGPAHDPDAEEPVSYLIEHPAGTIFHGGDTKPTDAFAEFADHFTIDIAIAAFGVVGNLLDRSHTERSRTEWYADENQVIEIANALEADRLLPTHWDMWKGMTADPTVLHHHARSWPYPNQFEIVEIGDRVDL